MSWISVRDRLPQNTDDVLVYSLEEGCFRAWYENQIWLSHETANNSTPTHWMSLPEFPKNQTSNGPSSHGMTDNLVSSETRPYSVWSETADTAKDIRKAWEARFGGPYKIVKSKKGYEVKYMGKWKDEPTLSTPIRAHR
jgi:hypothetical protein